MTNKHLLFPTTVVEDFYDDPDSIRNYVLALPTYKTGGYWPGRKTKSLDKVNKELNEFCCRRFLSIFYDFLNPVDVVMRTEFEISDPHSEDKDDPINRGWIHQDYNSVLAGVLYLTPNANQQSGTSFYSPKPDLQDEWYEVLRQDCTVRFDAFKSFGKDYDIDEYNKKFYNINSMFNKTLTVGNIYNRLVAFDSRQWHAYDTLVCDAGPRITQLFFVDSIGNCPTEPPYKRIRNVTL